MLPYLLKRVGWALVTLIGVTVLTFVVVYRIPGDPAALQAPPSASPQVLAAVRARMGLDRPLWEQYGRFLSNLSRGDLGESYTRGPVAAVIARRLPATVQLAAAGWICWLVLGTLIGTWVAARPAPGREAALLLGSILGVSMPTFWVGLLLLYIFVARLDWLPAGGSGSLRHLILPVCALALGGVAYYSRLAHSAMRATLREDYIRTAAAKGVSSGALVFRHALRNALLPLVTVAGADLAALLGGVVFTETVFDWKGMGREAVEAVARVDVPMIVGVVLVSAVFVVAANLIVDLLYPLVDPRIRAR